MRSHEIRSRFVDHFASRGHVRLPSGSLVPPDWDTSVLITTAGMQPLKRYFLGAEAAAGAARDDGAEVLPHGRHRRGRQHRPPPHLLRDDGQLLVRRLLQARRDRPGLGAGHVAHRVRASTPTRSGSPSTRATSSSPRTRRRSSCGGRSACPPSGSSGWAAITSGRPARPAPAARARSSTSTAGLRMAAAGRSAPRAATATGSSSSGTSFSCSTTCSRAAAWSRCPLPASTPVPAWSASPPCRRACTASSRPTPSAT